MKLITNPIFLEHDTGQHPENRSRLEVFDKEPATPIRIDGEAFLRLIHQREYIERVRIMSQTNNRRLDPDTVIGIGSYQAAVDGVGASLMAYEMQDFALVRPPGHHAYPDHSSGFCLFNNVAIVAEKLRTEGKRVLILDFDGHNGDGTSHIFNATDEVFYWSIHQFPAFPGFGRSDEIGTRGGEGFTLNVPLPPGSGDDIFLHAFQNYLPVVKQFKPDVLAISAGFDSHQHDPLLQLNLTVSTFYEIGQLIRDSCNHIFSVLEGGYNTQVLPSCVYNFVAGINGQAMPFSEVTTISNRQAWETYDLDLHISMALLANYWKF